MSGFMETDSLLTGSRYFGPARVLETAEAASTVRVELPDRPPEACPWARVAIPVAQPLGYGDEVLVAGEEISGLYVIGLLGIRTAVPQAPPAAAPERLELGNGAYAAVDGPPEAQTLRVFSGRKELLLEYDPQAEKARITVPSGDLEFATEGGDIMLRSARKIRFDAESIEMEGRRGIRLTVASVIGKLRSALELGCRRTKLSSPEVGVTAQRGEFYVEEATYSGRKFLGRIRDAKWIVGKLETLATTVVEKAKNVYRTVDQLTQLKTGRSRTLVDGTYHLKSKSTMMKSEEDFKIDGERIHLG